MQQPLKVLIVDDEWQSRALIRKLLSGDFPAAAVDEAETVSDALYKIKAMQPTLVLLDVHMRGETGFDLLDQIPELPSALIFTTAHSEYAVRAFKYSAMDYLIKPIDPAEFRTSVSKAIDRINSNQPQVAGQLDILRQLKFPHAIAEKLTIPTAEGFIFIPVSEIICCNALSNYTEFILQNNRKIVSSYTLGYYTELLENQHFFRVHRSHLVNLAHVTMYKKGDGGLVVMNNGDEIEVSRSNKEAFLKIFKV